MQMLSALERSIAMMPDPIGVAHDVNQAMYETLTPNPIEPEKYDLSLIPQEDWGASQNSWSLQFAAVLRAVRKKYPMLPPRPSARDVAATLNVPLSTTHQLIVGRIFSPSLRHALKRRLLAARRRSVRRAKKLTKD